MSTWQLYKIDEKIRKIHEFFDNAFDPDTGELLVSESDYEFHEKELENLFGNQQELIADLALVIKEDKLQEDSLKHERQRLQKRSKDIERRTESYRKAILRFMEKNNIPKIKSDLCSVSISEPKKVQYDVSELEEMCKEAAINVLKKNDISGDAYEIFRNFDFWKIEFSIKKTEFNSWAEKYPEIMMLGVKEIKPEKRLTIR